MDTATRQRQAQENLKSLAQNPYSGRGIIIGRNLSKTIQVYWITGRSKKSRNRVFEVSHGVLRTEAANPKELDDPGLIIYTAMDDSQKRHVVSNGNQTEQVVQCLINNALITLPEALFSCVYEPDKPNYTSRITGVCNLQFNGSHMFELAVLRKAIPGHNICDRLFYQYEDIEPGFGRGITTYSGGINESDQSLKPFIGEPWLLPLIGEPEAILETYWKVLEGENRIALAVKSIGLAGEKPEILIRNQYTKVS